MSRMVEFYEVWMRNGSNYRYLSPHQKCLERRLRSPHPFYRKRPRRMAGK